MSLSPKWRCGSMCRQGDNSETVDGWILSSPFFVLPAKEDKLNGKKVTRFYFVEYV